MISDQSQDTSDVSQISQVKPAKTQISYPSRPKPDNSLRHKDEIEICAMHSRELSVIKERPAHLCVPVVLRLISRSYERALIPQNLQI